MLDLVIVLAFIGWAVYTGFRAKSKASKDLVEYFLAGRTLSKWRAGLSMAATQFAADTPLLVAGLIATGGIFLLWRLWIYGIAFLMMGFIFAELWRRAGVLTDAELAEARYSGSAVLPLRVVKAVYYGTVINCVVLAMVLVAAMRIAEIFLPWHEWLPSGLYSSILQLTEYLGLRFGQGVTTTDLANATANNVISILAILMFTALYSTTGGLRAVVATDIGQFGLAMIATLAYAFVVVNAAGGLDNITEKIVAHYGTDKAHELLGFGPPPGEALLPFLVIICLQWLFQVNSDGTGYLAQRSMACRSDSEARGAGLIFAWVQIFLRSLLWLVIGVGLLVLEPFPLNTITNVEFAASREILFVTEINDLLPPGLRGLMLVGLLAALASTIDTHLNWGASYWANDIYSCLICKKWRKRAASNKELVWIARLSNIGIMGIALIIMAHLESIQQAWQISLLFGGGVGSVLILRWLWERINVFSEFAAIGASLVAAPLLLIMTNEEWVRLGGMALISTTVVILVTLITPSTNKEILQHFYSKVRPVGFWGTTAVSLGEHPLGPSSRLVKGLRTTALSACSLFCLLIGVGKLLFHLPQDASWIPWIFITFSLLLVPFWWREAIESSGPSAKD